MKRNVWQKLYFSDNAEVSAKEDAGIKSFFSVMGDNVSEMHSDNIADYGRSHLKSNPCALHQNPFGNLGC